MHRFVVLLLCALTLSACGGEHAGSHGNSAGEAASKGEGSVDRAFVAAMVPHHESAIEMAEIALERAESPFVRKLARDIVRSQREEIATMERVDATLGNAHAADLGLDEHEMGMHGDPADLRDAKDFDRAFVKMMVPHHEGALEMAEVQLASGTNTELKKLAQGIIASQRREIAAMKAYTG